MSILVRYFFLSSTPLSSFCTKWFRRIRSRNTLIRSSQSSLVVRSNNFFTQKDNSCLMFSPYPVKLPCRLAHSTPILAALPKRSALWRRVCGTRTPNHLSGSWPWLLHALLQPPALSRYFDTASTLSSLDRRISFQGVGYRDYWILWLPWDKVSRDLYLAQCRVKTYNAKLRLRENYAWWLLVDTTDAALEPFRFNSAVSPSEFAAWKSIVPS